MQLSAFVDGELPENEAELLLRRMSQDAELRQQVAEYLAIGRAMRGDAQVPGIDRLRERVAGELGEPLADDAHDEAVPGERRFVRPAVGFAVAASVALVAIFALNRVAVDDATPAGDENLTATPAVESILEELRQRHESEGLPIDSSRLVDFEDPLEEYVEIEAADGSNDEAEDDEEAAEETADSETAVE